MERLLDLRVEGELCESPSDSDASFLALVGCDGLGVAFFFELSETEGLLSCLVSFLAAGVLSFPGDLFSFISALLSLGVDLAGDETDWLLVVFSLLLLLEDSGDVGELAINSGEDSLVLVTLGESVSDSDRLAPPRVLLLGLLTEEVVVFLGFAVSTGAAFFKSLPLVVESPVPNTVLFPLLVTGLLTFFFGVSFSDFSP